MTTIHTTSAIGAAYIASRLESLYLTWNDLADNCRISLTEARAAAAGEAPTGTNKVVCEFLEDVAAATIERIEDLKDLAANTAKAGGAPVLAVPAEHDPILYGTLKLPATWWRATGARAAAECNASLIYV